MCLAIPGQIVTVDGQKAVVDVDGFRENISLAAISNVVPGDYVLVHAGYAVEKVSEQAAEELLQELIQLFGECNDTA